MPCQACGIEGPTKYVELYQNIGMFYARRMVNIKGNLCRPCIGRYFRSFTLTTLFLGWWGIISFVMTPFILINNVVRYLGALSLPMPNMASVNMPIDAKPRPVGSGSFKFKLIYGMIIWGAVLAFVAYHSVGFLEKHAPTINAKLHGGEISDDADAEYSGTKIGNDIVALEAEFKSKEWAGLRSEMLSRTSYLVDLTAQNDKLQRQFTKERDANVAANDACEKLALDEFGPAVNDYTSAMNDTFSLVKSTTAPTSETGPALDKLTAREEGSMARLRAYFSDRKSHGCDSK